jgi:hypothetical protein
MEVALLHEGLNEISASPESNGTLCLVRCLLWSQVGSWQSLLLGAKCYWFFTLGKDFKPGYFLEWRTYLLDNQHPLVTTILITLVVCYMNHRFLSIIKEWKIILSSTCNNRSKIHLGDKFKHLIDVLSIWKQHFFSFVLLLDFFGSIDHKRKVSSKGCL